MKLKYVIFDETFPVLFGDYFNHTAVSGEGRKATSAGFVSIQEIDTPEGSSNPSVRMLEATCWGESVGLNIKSNPEMDKHLIERMLNWC